LLFIYYYILYIIYYLLFIIYYYLLFIIYYLLFITYYLLLNSSKKIAEWMSKLGVTHEKIAPHTSKHNSIAK
jgi:hypothetical protein